MSCTHPVPIMVVYCATADLAVGACNAVHLSHGSWQLKSSMSVLVFDLVLDPFQLYYQ